MRTMSRRTCVAISFRLIVSICIAESATKVYDTPHFFVRKNAGICRRQEIRAFIYVYLPS
jgi:hypothetical protein